MIIFFCLFACLFFKSLVKFFKAFTVSNKSQVWTTLTMFYCWVSWDIISNTELSTSWDGLYWPLTFRKSDTEWWILLFLLILSKSSGTSLFCHLLLWFLWLLPQMWSYLVQQLQIFLALMSFLLAHLHLLSLETSCVTQADSQFYTYFPCLEPSWLSDGSVTAELSA